MLKSGTQNVLLSGSVALAGLGMPLCSGPFWMLPGTQVRSWNTVLGTITPVKSSLAAALNSTRTVSSLAVCVPAFVCLICRGFFPVLMAFCSRLASALAAFGLPPVFFRSKSHAFARAAFLTPSLVAGVFWSLDSRNLGATGLIQVLPTLEAITLESAGADAALVAPPLPITRPVTVRAPAGTTAR